MGLTDSGTGTPTRPDATETGFSGGVEPVRAVGVAVEAHNDGVNVSSSVQPRCAPTLRAALRPSPGERVRQQRINPGPAPVMVVTDMDGTLLDESGNKGQPAEHRCTAARRGRGRHGW